MAAKKQLNFEQSMERLEQIVSRLEEGDGTLEEAMALFEEGGRLARSCSTMLDHAEQKVTKLLSGGGEVLFDGTGEEDGIPF